MGSRGFCSSRCDLSFEGAGGVCSRRAFLALPWAQMAARKAETSAFDLSLLDEGATPNDLFFVREHFPAPAVAQQNWKLAVGGAVENPFELSYDELVAEPRKSLGVTLECAENPAGGGLVSHAEWSGSSLAALVDRARPRGEARLVRLRGADGDYARSIPIEKARHPATLLAHRMNGERLPPAHGFPLRAVIPGWYGMDSVKWLTHIELLAGPDHNAFPYVRRVRSLLGERIAGPVTAMQVKSVFARPQDGAILVGRRFTIRGAAWAGENRVQAVEVSTDGGESWHAARVGDTEPYAWVRWEYEWKIPRPGEYKLMVRAAGQPGERPADRIDDYEQNGWQTVGVRVV